MSRIRLILTVTAAATAAFIIGYGTGYAAGWLIFRRPPLRPEGGRLT